MKMMVNELSSFTNMLYFLSLSFLCSADVYLGQQRHMSITSLCANQHPIEPKCSHRHRASSMASCIPNRTIQRLNLHVCTETHLWQQMKQWLVGSLCILKEKQSFFYLQYILKNFKFRSSFFPKKKCLHKNYCELVTKMGRPRDG